VINYSFFYILKTIDEELNKATVDSRLHIG